MSLPTVDRLNATQRRKTRAAHTLPAFYIAVIRDEAVVMAPDGLPATAPVLISRAIAYLRRRLRRNTATARYDVAYDVERGCWFPLSE